MRFAHPPAGSCFVFDYDGRGRPRLTIPALGSLSRWLSAAYIALWLCAWWIGELCMGMVLRNMFLGVGQVGFSVVMFILACFVAWTIAGAHAALVLYTLVRGGKSERLTFDKGMLVHEPGWDLNAGNKPVSLSEYYARFVPWPWRRLRTVSTQQITQIRLDRIGERQRLTIDHGAERIELGQWLTEPEREWLLAMLTQWMSTGRPKMAFHPPSPNLLMDL